MNDSELSKLFEYNPETGLIVWKESRGTTKKGREAGYIRTIKTRFYRVVHANKRDYLSHRLAWFLHYSRWPKNQIDHIDGDGTNNRIDNLRDVTASENNKNRQLSKKSKSGIIGVAWLDDRQKWRAVINVGGKNKYLGVFKTKLAAAYARHCGNLTYGYHENHGRKSI